MNHPTAVSDKKLPPAGTGGKEELEMNKEVDTNPRPDTRIPQEVRDVNPWIGKVHVQRVTPANKPGNVRAFVDVGIGQNSDRPSLTLCGCKVVQQPGQRAWVAMPDRQGDGGRWFAAARLDDERLKQTITSVVLAAWQEVMDARPAEQTGKGRTHGFSN